MKSVAVFKWAVNPQDARVSADGTVDWGAASRYSRCLGHSPGAGGCRVRSLGSVDVVTIGDSAWELSVPVMLAGLLGWRALMACATHGD
ncbi:hypothetical protein AT727_22010 [Desulfitobacterium hafniense]|uniref:Uncharacterized protein n=1 Tax=Desulfitobacterium hafniense TaxID=49338 RepID=A0A098B4H5_DESHA|nr:hypothetical protein AT727_22010 [Desulfitobacterium hafniense]CDX03739.1 Hypothetical protein DPCES_3853 [Desulfitobacterium hafniense]